MEFRQLKTFEAVSRLGSLSRASDELNVAQPALGRQIRMLEEEMGTALFIRHPRGMVLTAEGQTFLGSAVKILDNVADAKGKLSSENTNTTEIELGIPPSLVDLIVAPLSQIFRESMPNVSVKMICGMSRHTMDWLLTDEVDIGFFYETVIDPKICEVPILEEPVYLISPSKEGEVGLQPAIDFDDLKEEKLIISSRKHALRAVLDNIVGEREIGLDIVSETESLDIQKRLMLEGHGSLLLPYWGFNQELQESQVIARQVINPEVNLKLLLGFRSDVPQPKINRVVSRQSYEFMVNLVKRGSWDAKILPQGQKFFESLK